MKSIFTILFSLLAMCSWGQFQLIELDDSPNGNDITQVTDDEYGVYFYSRGDKAISGLNKETGEWLYLLRDDYDFSPNAQFATDLVIIEGEIWIDYSYRMDYFDGEEVRLLSSFSGDLRSDFVNCIENIDGQLIIGYGQDKGISVRSDEWIHKGDFESDLLNEISNPTFIGQADEIVWINDDSKLYAIDDDGISVYDHDDMSLPANLQGDYIHDAIEYKGQIWFAIYDTDNNEGGLLVLDGMEWQFYDRNNSDFPELGATELEVYEDDLFVAGSSGRLLVYNSSNWNRYSHQNSNYPETPTDINDMLISEETKTLYMATDKGLITFDVLLTSTTDEDKDNPFLVVQNNLLQWENIGENCKINIYDLQGRLIATTLPNMVDISALTSGLYVSQVIFENGGNFSQKFVKI